MDVIELPRLRSVARRGIPRVLEATIVPMVIFYVAFQLAGLGAALAGALLWTYGALARRLLLGERVTAILVLGAVGITVRTILAMASGSAFVYFAQPTLGTLAVAAAFLISVPAGRPLVARLAADFIELPARVQQRPAVRRLFTRLSLLWAVVHVANAAVTIWLLLSQPLGTYLWTKSAATWSITAVAIVVTVTASLRTARSEGLLPAHQPVLEPVSVVVETPALVPALAAA